MLFMYFKLCFFVSLWGFCANSSNVMLAKQVDELMYYVAEILCKWMREKKWERTRKQIPKYIYDHLWTIEERFEQ